LNQWRKLKCGIEEAVEPVEEVKLESQIPSARFEEMSNEELRGCQHLVAHWRKSADQSEPSRSTTSNRLRKKFPMVYQCQHIGRFERMPL
jgi:hypothetical protein